MDDGEVAGEALERHGRRHLQQVDETGDVVQDEGTPAKGHAIGADQSKGLLRSQLDRLEAYPLQRCPSAQDVTADLCVADAYQYLSDVRHLREVPLANRADFPDDGMYVPVEELDEQLCQLAAHTDARGRHAVGSGHHHRPHDVARQWPAVGRSQVRTVSKENRPSWSGGIR